MVIFVLFVFCYKSNTIVQADIPSMQYSYPPNGTYRIRSLNSDKYLDVVGAGTTPGTRVDQFDANGTLAQEWVLTNLGNPHYSIKSALGNLYLDVDGGIDQDGRIIQVFSGNGSAAQQWSIQAIGNGYSAISPAITSSRVLDVDGVSKDNGAVVHLWSFVNGANQEWFLEPCGSSDITYESHYSGAEYYSDGVTVGIIPIYFPVYQYMQAEHANYSVSYKSPYYMDLFSYINTDDTNFWTYQESIGNLSISVNNVSYPFSGQNAKLYPSDFIVCDDYVTKGGVLIPMNSSLTMTGTTRVELTGIYGDCLPDYVDFSNNLNF